jgi:hypothetical protein
VRGVAAALAFTVIVTSVAAQQQAPPIPAGAERAYQALKGRVDGAAAMDVVRFMDQYWRVAGNPGFNASVDRIRDGLQKAGLTPRDANSSTRGRGWDYQAGTVAFADSGEVLLSRENELMQSDTRSFSRESSTSALSANATVPVS